MKKSAKLSLALALMMGTTAGVNMVAPSSASAEISDKFRMELNGVIANYSDKDNAGGYTVKDNYGNNKYKHNHWNNYGRLQLNYFVDKDTKFQARLHSDFDGVAEYGKNRGFALDPNRFMPGEKISNFKDLKQFILNIAEDKDPFANERNDVNKLINQYPNGGYCQRVLDFSGLSVN